MNKTLLKSVREYKKQSVLAPFFVILEVLMEVLIPMEMAKIIDVGIMQGNLSYIVRRGLILVIMAMLALYFGIIAGKMAATAGAGYAKNLRHDIFYKVQEFSFKNIDRFSTSGLVTRKESYGKSGKKEKYSGMTRFTTASVLYINYRWKVSANSRTRSLMPEIGRASCRERV